MTANRRNFTGMSLLAAASVLLLAGPAVADYPEQPITMIVAYPPGGSTDQTARLLATFLRDELGGNANIVVDNRAGAGGETGFRALAAADPDGYTIGFINTPNVLTIPIERKTRFDWHSYDLLGNVIDDPGNFSVLADSEIKSLADLAAYAKAHPGDVTYGTTGIGSDDHLAMLAFESLAGVEMTHVPFKGASDVRTALTGGHIMVGAMNIGEAMAAQASGAPIRNLGQMSSAAQRHRAGRAHLQGAGLRYRGQFLAGHGRPEGAASPDPREACDGDRQGCGKSRVPGKNEVKPYAHALPGAG